MRKAWFILLIVTLLLSTGFTSGIRWAHAQGLAPEDTPTALVSSGVHEYALAAPKVFWYTGVPACPPAAPSDPSSPTTYPETIKRIASYGSPVRTLFLEQRDCGDGQVFSNIAADESYLYWLGPVGLMRLSTDANPGDAPELVNALVDAPGEVLVASDRIYVIHNNNGGASTEVSYVWKSNNQRVHLSSPGNYAYNLKFDGTYVYYTVGTSLIRLEPGVNSGVSLTTGVTGYYPEGQRLLFCTINPFQCFYSDIVYVGKGRNIYTYNNNTGTLSATPIYTSVDSTASVYQLKTDFSHLFFYESRVIPCSPQPCFNSSSYVLQRTSRSGGAADALYTFGPNFLDRPENLTGDGTYLYWQESGMVQRLPDDAAALPQINMYVTGLEVTQAIQNLSNSVRLIKGKRTFVRVYVRSASPSVSGVTAQLYADNIGGGPLQPVNPVGTKITVRANPDRDSIDQSFLFELPWNWTNQSSLTLRAELNPYKIPLEPNYLDNSGQVTVNLSNSPTLSVEFFRLNYTMDGTTYSPRYEEDILPTYSWILRAYPLGGAVGDKFKPRIWDVDGGTMLAGLVDTSNPLCALVYDDPDDDISLCASYFANAWLFAYRIASMFGALEMDPDAFYYGMISDAGGFFPRGQAVYDRTSVGPAGIPGNVSGLGSGWDTDGTYGDWYAAHEIGHSLGRAHPNPGSDNPNVDGRQNCGHSRSDPSYPYGNTSTSAAPIGPADGSMEGFDVGDPALGIPPAVLPSDTWNDLMSYCNNQWISDYTYNAMYNYMIAHPSQTQSRPASAVAGNFLMAAGAINPVTSNAGFAMLRRLDSVVNVPLLTPGGYALRLLGATNNVLASYPFTPQADPDTGLLNFAVVVDYASATRRVQVVRTSDNQELGYQMVSANSPVVSNVALQGAPNPVSGVVTLGWSASDADGNALVFDIAYSRDGGATFQPVAVNVTGNSTQIDTALLGGSRTAILRVTASDGANTGFADSAAFVMSAKPPQPFIISPADNIHIHYGQLVNFSGLALDAQDGYVASAGLSWQDELGNVFGSGPLLSLDALPVGTNVISLVATNSSGLQAVATVTLVVDDDLTLPGPTLIAGPGALAWQVNEGSTTIQTNQLSIGNAGSGDLTWTASDNASWISLGASGGTVTSGGDPVALTVNADPTGLAGGTTYSGLVTITKPATVSSPLQTVTIPVSLSVGFIWSDPPSPTPATHMFLPVLRR